MIVYPVRPGPGQGRVVSIALPEWTADQDLAARLQVLSVVVDELEGEGLLRQPWLFRGYALAMGAVGKVREGTVLLRDDMGPRALLQRLAEGFGQTSLRITLPEGFNRFDVASRLDEWAVVDREAFLNACKDPAVLAEVGLTTASVEGYLFPDTYHFMDQSEPLVVLSRLVRTAQTRVQSAIDEAEQAGENPALDELSFEPADVITLASIVEKEAAVPEEQPIIAGVFLNRLRDPEFVPKRLQADPTVAYGCLLMPELSSCEAFDGRRVTRRMTADANNLYNTYRHEGLPPGPISNPGLSAIRAVLFPAEHEYLYFVARGQGRHRFSATLQEHNAAVNAVRRLQ